MMMVLTVAYPRLFCLGALLFGVNPYEPGTMFMVAFALAAIAFSATFIPAQRAIRVEPRTALHHE